MSKGMERVKYWCVNIAIKREIYKSAQQSHESDFTPLSMVIYAKKEPPQAQLLGEVNAWLQMEAAVMPACILYSPHDLVTLQFPNKASTTFPLFPLCPVSSNFQKYIWISNIYRVS